MSTHRSRARCDPLGPFILDLVSRPARWASDAAYDQTPLTAERLEPGTHAALVLDQAGWHVARRLAVPDNVTLLPLPPYSPELNPVERVWLYLRERFLSHRVLDGYTAVLDAACRAWNTLAAEPGRLASLTAYPYLLRSELP